MSSRRFSSSRRRACGYDVDSRVSFDVIPDGAVHPYLIPIGCSPGWSWRPGIARIRVSIPAADRVSPPRGECWQIDEIGADTTDPSVPALTLTHDADRASVRAGLRAAAQLDARRTGGPGWTPIVMRRADDLRLKIENSSSNVRIGRYRESAFFSAASRPIRGRARSRTVHFASSRSRRTSQVGRRISTIGERNRSWPWVVLSAATALGLQSPG